MSVRKSFEKLNIPEPEDIRLKFAEGIVNEFKVTILLWELRHPFGPIKKYQLVASVETDDFSKHSSDSKFFDERKEAEEQFNLQMIQYELKETHPTFTMEESK